MAVSRQATEAGREIQDVLQEANPTTLGFSALALGGGAVLAQEVSQQVLSLLGRPVDPTSGTDLGISGASKVGFALVLGAAAARMGRGLGFLVAVMAALGSLTSAGVDFFDMLQRSGLPGLEPQAQAQRRAQARRASTDGGTDTSPSRDRTQQQPRRPQSVQAPDGQTGYTDAYGGGYAD